jgi:hypothetical protein
MPTDTAATSRLTGLTAAARAATPFEAPEARFWDHEESGFETGTLGVFPHISHFLSVLLNPRDCFLVSISALGSKLGGGVGVLRLWPSDVRK